MATEKENVCGVCNCQIKENTFFSGLTEKQVDAFKNDIKTSFYGKREVVYLEGDECKGVYIVRLGRVKLVRSSRSGKEQIIKILTNGDLLGLEAFYSGNTYASTAITMEETDLCFLDRDAFFSILKKEPEISTRLVMALSRELDQAYAQIGNMGLFSAREKLAHLICTLADEYGSEDNGHIRLHLTFSRLEIAEMLGITQETSIRLLKSFEEEGIIDIRNKELLIKEMERLRETGGIAK